MKNKTELLAEREKILEKLRKRELKYIDARPIIHELDAKIKSAK